MKQIKLSGMVPSALPCSQLANVPTQTFKADASDAEIKPIACNASVELLEIVKLSGCD